MDEAIWGKWSLTSMWRDVQRVGEAECVRNVKMDIFRRRDWWAKVSSDNMCLCTKSIRQPPSGELHSLLIPDAPWDTASVDFIVELPESNGKDAIMVVVDSVTKQSHFVSTVTTLSAARTAQLYLYHILLGDIPSCMYPFIYPSYHSHFTFITFICYCLAITLIWVVVSNHSFISLLLKPPCFASFLLLYLVFIDCSLSLESSSPLSLQVALTPSNLYAWLYLRIFKGVTSVRGLVV